MLRLIQRSPQLNSELETSNHSRSELCNEHFKPEDTQDTDRAKNACQFISQNVDGEPEP